MKLKAAIHIAAFNNMQIKVITDSYFKALRSSGINCQTEPSH